MKKKVETKPCEYCGKVLSKTATQQGQRKYWTCDRSCANKLRIQLGNTPKWADNPLRGQKETRPCAHCGTPVTRYLSQRITAKDWTCSRSCMGKVNMARQAAEGRRFQPQKPRRGTETPCEVCGKPVYVNKSARAKGEGRYCSRACNAIAQSKEPIIKHCPVCDKEMRLKPSQAVRQFCSKTCEAWAKTVRPLDRMHNGKRARLDPKGYVLIWEPTHSTKALKGWQYEHRYVVEQQLGRALTRTEHVDHRNQVKHDNRPENLQVLSPSAHSVKTWKDRTAELEEYRRRYGPLEQEA